MTLKESSVKWGAPSRQVNYHCVVDCMPGTVKMDGVWFILKEAEKPVYKRRKCGDDYEQK